MLNILVRNQKKAAWSMRHRVDVSLCPLTIVKWKTCLQSSLPRKFDNLWYTCLRERNILFSVASNSKLQSHLCSLYNTRVWKVYPFRNVRITSISKSATLQKMWKGIILHSAVSPVRTVKSIASFVASKSLSVVDMLKFGEIIIPVEKLTNCWGWRIQYRE